MKIAGALPFFCFGSQENIGEMMFSLGNSVMNPNLSTDLREKIAAWMDDARIIKGFRIFHLI